MSKSEVRILGQLKINEHETYKGPCLENSNSIRLYFIIEAGIVAFFLLYC